MMLRGFHSIWRKTAENLILAGSSFSLLRRCANLFLVNDGKSISRLTRIPSLSRGLSPFGTTPVFLRVHSDAPHSHPFPMNLPLPMTTMSLRPRRTDHV